MHSKCITLLLFLIISSCYCDYKNVAGVATNEAALDQDGQLFLKWQVDYTLQKIRFHVTISDKAPAFTWFALGFSDRGDVANSDVCLFWTDYYSASHYEDMHTNGSGQLIRDSKQNCEMFYYDPDSRVITFERQFDTCDSDDFLIEDDTAHIIWARGNQYLSSSEQLCMSCVDVQDHGLLRIRLLVPVAKPQVGEARPVTLTAGNYSLSANPTTYMCRVFRRPEFLDEKVYHIVKYEGLVTPGNEHIVHHIKIIYCDDDPEVEMPIYQGLCPNRPTISKRCSKIKAAWAYGAAPFTYPDETGLTLGGPNTNKYLMIEIHYNNEFLKSGVVDDSGIILHIGERRKYDAALLELGVDYTDKMAVPPGQKAFTWTGFCVPQCIGVSLPPEGITVFGSQLHTHLTGVAVWTRHMRHGAELPPLDRDMHYSTYYQEIRILHEPVTVLPGDFLETTCVYNTEDRVNATVGGHGTTDEMCGNYLHYYPATELDSCKSSVSALYLRNYFNFERRWYGAPIDPYDSPRKNYRALGPWNTNRVSTVQSLLTEFPIDVICNKTGGQFPGEWIDQPIPRIAVPYPEIPRMCPDPVSGFF